MPVAEGANRQHRQLNADQAVRRTSIYRGHAEVTDHKPRLPSADAAVYQLKESLISRIKRTTRTGKMARKQTTNGMQRDSEEEEEPGMKDEEENGRRQRRWDCQKKDRPVTWFT